MGGASRRMGTDKALVEVDGVPLASRVAAALAAGGAAPVALVGSGAGERAELVLGGRRLPVVGDDRPGAGPLAGLATALRWAAGPARAEMVVVAACDQPDLSAELVAALVEALDRAPAEVAAAVPVSVDGRRHPFPSAWRSPVADAVEGLVAGGARRMVDAWELGVVTVGAAAELLVDLDTPAELAARRTRGGGLPRRLSPPDPLLEHRPVDVPEIDIAETAARIAAGTPVIDVREPAEYQEAHVPGAVLIPLGSVAARSGEVPTEGEVLIICRSGARSRKAAEHLRSLGIDATNVGGGTLAWIEAGHPVATGDEPGA